MNEQWFYNAMRCTLFCKELEQRGATYVRLLDRDMEVVRWIEYFQWQPVSRQGVED